MKKIVCLLTDFGLKDNYVSTMKGVILGKETNVQFVDITHAVPPQNVSFAAFQLLTCFTFFPEGTLFLCVVDPGVGGSRGILYADAARRRFIAPDNGLLSWVFRESPPKRCLDISQTEKADVSRTFHGRDVMARYAAALLAGRSPKGERKDTWVDLSFPVVQKLGSKWTAEVLAVDTFGNVITNLRTDDLAAFQATSTVWIDVGKKHAPIRGLASSYSAVDKGKALAIGGSSGFVELAVRDGNAAERLGLQQGGRIAFTFKT